MFKIKIIVTLSDGTLYPFVEVPFAISRGHVSDNRYMLQIR